MGGGHMEVIPVVDVLGEVVEVDLVGGGEVD